jgi:hypothetical protein
MSLFTFIKKLFKKEQNTVCVNDQITDSVTQIVVETPKVAKPKKPKATKKVELSPEQSEKIVKEIKNKGVYQGTPKKKKQK